MARTVAIGIQDFEQIRKNNCFYVDKTKFIKEWWESGDSVTLIARPRRFGKTLNMSMLEEFFSLKYADRGDLFEGLSIWKEEKYRKLQGTYPVISLSFARVKEVNNQSTRDKICEIIRNVYIKYAFIRESDALLDADRDYFDCILSVDVSDVDDDWEEQEARHHLKDLSKKVVVSEQQKKRVKVFKPKVKKMNGETYGQLK